MQARALRGGLHLLAQLRVERRRGRLLDQFLVPPLDRAFPLAARQHAAVRVAHDLDLDVPRRGDRLLDVERAVPERRVGLGRRVGIRSVDLRGPADDPQAAPAAAGGRLEQYRVTELLGRDPGLREARGPLRAGDERHAGGPQLRLRLRFVAHSLHHVGRRAHEDELVLLAGAHEGGVLGEEAVPGMHRFAAGRRRSADDRGHRQIALRGGRRSDADRTVGEPDVQRVLVRRRVDGDGLDPELVQGADHAHGDLAAVRNQDAAEHQTASSGRPVSGSRSNSTCPNSTGCALATWIFRTIASRSAFTSFISFIASRMQSV